MATYDTQFNKYGLGLIRNGNRVFLYEKGGYGLSSGLREITDPQNLSQYGIDINSLPDESAHFDSESLSGKYGISANTGKSNISASQLGNVVNNYVQNEQAYDPNNPNNPTNPNNRSIPASSTTSATVNSSTATGVSSSASSSGLQYPSFDQALATVYANRPDLQALYNPDGTAKNPGDPRLQGIPTLQAWAQTYGVKEEPLLQTAQSNPQGSNVPSTSSNASSTSTGTGTASVTPTDLGPYQGLYDQLKQYLDKLQASGQMINPNVSITPEKIAEFTQAAKNQIHPYYATQLQAASDQFLKSLGYSAQSIAAAEQKAQTTYGRSLDNLAARSADQGFAQSGIRQKEEAQLAQDTQSDLDQNRRQLGENAYSAATQFAQRFGGTNVPTAPTISAEPRVLPGVSKFDTSGSNTGLYSLDPGIYNQLIGSEQNAEKEATDTLASKLGENYTQGLANTQTRQLNI